MIFDTIETATALLTLFVMTRILLSAFRLYGGSRSVLLDGPPDVLHTDVQPGERQGQCGRTDEKPATGVGDAYL